MASAGGAGPTDDGWVRTAKRILSGQWAEAGAKVTNMQVAERFDCWWHQFTLSQDDGELSDEQQSALAHFLKVTTYYSVPWKLALRSFW